jgi:predicted metal-dependent hydrolase
MLTADDFKNDVKNIAKQLNVNPKEIQLRNMKHKWASCTSKGRLTFDKFILNESKEVRYKIIIHELLHLRYPNHGKFFKLLLDAYLEQLLK